MNQVNEKRMLNKMEKRSIQKRSILIATAIFAVFIFIFQAPIVAASTQTYWNFVNLNGAPLSEGSGSVAYEDSRIVSNGELGSVKFTANLVPGLPAQDNPMVTFRWKVPLSVPDDEKGVGICRQSPFKEPKPCYTGGEIGTTNDTGDLVLDLTELADGVELISIRISSLQNGENYKIAFCSELNNCNPDIKGTGSSSPLLNISAPSGTNYIKFKSGDSGKGGNDYIVSGITTSVPDEEKRCGDGIIDMPQETCDDGNTANGDGCSEICKREVKIVAQKIVCEDESDLPNWGNGGPNIESNTAQNFVNTHPECHFESDWFFQWANSTKPNPGDNIGTAGSGWTTFGPTNNNGKITTTISGSSVHDLWLREVVKEDYIPFSGSTSNPRNDTSAEFYCYKDVLNYDNYDRIDNPEPGETYYCIAFNVLKQEESFCGDGTINIPDEECDDGNDNNGDSCSNECTENECVMNLTKTDSPDPVSPGDTLKYKITLENIGTADCTGGGVLLKEYYPSLASYVSASPAPTSDNNLWNFGVIHPGDSRQVNITMHVSNSSQCETLTNKACFWTAEYNRWECVEEDTETTCNPEPYCGNEIVESGEQCDDGNDNNTDACTNSCSLPRCGDVIVSPPEQCDDGNTNNNDLCKNDCTVRQPQCGDGNLDSGEQCDDGNDNNGDGCNAICKKEVKIVAQKIVCDNESDLPNWGNGGPNIESNTAQNFVNTHPECHFESDWFFQWANSTKPNPGDNIGTAGSGWTTFGPTNSTGVAATFASNFGNLPHLWAREVFQNGFIPFTFNSNNQTNVNNVSAEFYCSIDVLNYDNYDKLDDPQKGETFYCVAFNVATPLCGNGVVQSGEQCDDGNTVNTDACTNSCQNAVCGDGKVRTGVEQCDDGNTYNNDGCTNSCNLPRCGDVIVSPPEQCDDGNTYNNDGCTNQCLTEFCGDGVVQTGEVCDDGNIVNGDGCSAICEEEEQICQHDVGVRFTYSNGVGTGIAIRPANNSTGWLLDDPQELIKGANYTIKYFIDNNIENTSNFIHVVVNIDGETLANYNTSINAFHSKEVSLNVSELEYQSYNITVFVEKVYEQDCNTTDNFAWREVIIVPLCGNNVVESGEQCDDGNTNNNDLCKNDCTVRQPQCGDGNLDSGEQCDDGNTVNTDACTNSCQNAICGDGKVRTGVEQCDDGNDYNNDGCTNQCELPQCGDGYLQAGEQCDDGNDYNNDGCTNQCLTEFCGDSIVQTGEQCDDGNTANGDGCGSTCEEEKECTNNSDCTDGLFCNGEEVCNQDYECVPGTSLQVSDGLFCTTDICDESQNKILHNPLIVNDSVACTNDICDEQLNKIVHQPNDNYCNDGLFCDGNEYCNPQLGCQPGIVVSCSAFNLPEIRMCTNNPDSNPVTLDFAPGFTSVCNERTDSCTIGSRQFTHTCNANMCGAECETGESQSIQCGTNVGECEFGEIELQCTASCKWESDTGRACIGGVGPATEICDGKDNNCNGQTDEGFLDDFDRLSYTSRNTGDVISIDGYFEFTDENVDFFHGQIYEEKGEYFGDGSMHVRGTSTNGTEVQLNLKFKVTGLVEFDCEKIVWRNSARGTYWIYGEGTQSVEYDYMDITYHLLTGEIDAVGVGDVDFELEGIVDERFGE